MEKRLSCLKFQVASLAEVRTLTYTWEDLVATIFDRTPFRLETALKLARYGTVQVTVEPEEEAGRDVFLVMLGPQALVRRFLRTLRVQGLAFSEEMDQAEGVIHCQLKQANVKP